MIDENFDISGGKTVYSVYVQYRIYYVRNELILLPYMTDRQISIIIN